MQTTSLVKYHSPILVSIANAKGKINNPATTTTTTTNNNNTKTATVKKTPAVVEKPATTQTEDILNSILPPRYAFTIITIIIIIHTLNYFDIILILGNSISINVMMMMMIIMLCDIVDIDNHDFDDDDHDGDDMHIINVTICTSK